MYARSSSSLSYLIVQVSSTKSRPVSAMLDTGAEMNIITKSLCEEAGALIVSGSFNTVAFGGSEVRMVGLTEVSLLIGGCEGSFVFHVVDDSRFQPTHEILLGMPFIMQSEFSFEYTRDKQLRGNFLLGKTRLVATILGSTTEKKPQRTR